MRQCKLHPTEPRDTCDKCYDLALEQQTRQLLFVRIRAHGEWLRRTGLEFKRA